MIYCFENYSLDVGARELRCAGETRRVEPKVLALLELLIANAERMVSKDEIVETVWDGRIISDGAINARVKLARKALDDDGKQQRLIKTIHGQGFRFIGKARHDEDIDDISLGRSTAKLDLPDKPSIAVLPFDNMSDDPAQEFLADGMCEDILTALSKIPQLFVVARNSTFVYKGKAVDVRQIGREQGVRYVLEGSVRSSGDKMRITGQLIDATTGNHVWAERFDRSKQDFFKLQDEMTQCIVSEMLGELITTHEQAKLWAGGTKDFHAWESVVRATELIATMEQANLIEAHAQLQRALALDANYGLAYVVLANAHFQQLINGWSEDPRLALAMIKNNAQKALAINEADSLASAMLAFVTLAAHDFAKAYELARIANDKGPNIIATVNLVAMIYTYCQRFEEAEALCRHAMRLNPIGRTTVSTTAAFVYTSMEKYGDAMQCSQELMGDNPENLNGLVTAVICHQAEGNKDEAASLSKKLIETYPLFSVNAYLAAKLLERHTIGERSRSFLIGAGLPE